MPKTQKVKGLRLYEVCVRKERIKYARFFVKAPDLETIKTARMRVLTAGLQSSDWDGDEEECSIHYIGECQSLRPLGGERLNGYIVNHKYFPVTAEAESLIKEIERYRKKPLPGQMGIPGLAQDIPLKK